jgi:formyltetrahydrofolate deformylase
MAHRLLITCPDQPGIIAEVSRFLFDQGANIVHSDQHTSSGDPRRFFLRVEFEGVAPDLSKGFKPIADRFSMQFRFVDGESRKRILLLASKEDHCPQELLWQIRAGDINAAVAGIAANHDSMRPLADEFGLSFFALDTTDRSGAETRILELAAGADLLVLARYMQILSPEFLRSCPVPAINIHHSFLPAFVGANPYKQAFARGVKLIGATAHYVTEELDAGPIIDQDVQRVDHRMDVADLRRIGRLSERMVLARAVKWHAEDRVLLDGHRTVVFS